MKHMRRCDCCQGRHVRDGEREVLPPVELYDLFARHATVDEPGFVAKRDEKGDVLPALGVYPEHARDI